MSRLRTDQACLDAQLRQQVQCQLTAELAQPRDTIPCPAPTESLERASARAFVESFLGDKRYFTKWRCPACSRVQATQPLFKIDCCTGHAWTAMVPVPFDGDDKTPTASDCAAATAPDVDEAVLPRAAGDSGRPVCACGQTVWAKGTDECADCTQMRWTSGDDDDPVHLDERIREAQTREPDAVQCAWSTPSSEGESW